MERRRCDAICRKISARRRTADDRLNVNSKSREIGKERGKDLVVCFLVLFDRKSRNWGFTITRESNGDLSRVFWSIPVRRSMLFFSVFLFEARWCEHTAVGGLRYLFSKLLATTTRNEEEGFVRTQLSTYVHVRLHIYRSWCAVFYPGAVLLQRIPLACSVRLMV